MKTPSLTKCLSSLSVAILAITSVGALAQGDGVPTPTLPSLIIALEAHATLSPPIITPGGVGAAAEVVVPVPVAGPRGGAEVEAINVDGKKDAEVEVSTRDLAPDTYTVSVKKKSDGSEVKLGTFTVDPVVVVGAAAATPVVGGPRRVGTFIKFGTRSGTPLPAGFDGFDVASITVSDGKGNVVLAGDLTKNSFLVKNARLVAETPAAATAAAAAPVVVAPKLGGFVSIFTATRGGVTTSRFSLIAFGLPPAAALQLSVDGADVQAVTPDKRGFVNVRSLPATVNLPAVQKVAIHDAANVNLLHASF